MIGPSSGTTTVSSHEVVANGHARPAKRKVFEDVSDLDTFCEEVWKSERKEYIQDLVEVPATELVMTEQMINNTEDLISVTSEQEATADECSVARLKVLVVDGTNYTWTTISDVTDQQQHHHQQYQHQEQHQQQQEIDSKLTMFASTSLSSSSSSLSPPTSSPPSFLSFLGHRREHILYSDIQTVEKACNGDFQQAISSNDYWEPVTSVVIPTIDQICRNKSEGSGELENVANECNEEQQQQQQYQKFEDQENGNLSWLLDFKLDSFIEATDDKSTANEIDPRDNHYGKNKLNGRPHGSTIYANYGKKSCNYGGNKSAPTIQQHQGANNGPAYSASQDFSSVRCNTPKKPPFTYTELIEHALQEKGELTVSAIYQWISEHFPYYKSNDDRWKNSVRHNLSINPHFRKGSKAPHGAGHLWAIANSSDNRTRQFNTFDTTKSLTRSIHDASEGANLRRNENIIGEIVLLDEVEAATASIVQESSKEETDNTMSPVTLEHCAEQILNGVKKEVEVQYLVPMLVANNETHDANQINQQNVQTDLHCPVKESDFLNPIAKEIVAEECGLISEGYLIADMNSAALGLNMSESEIITPDNLFDEELSFQFYELSSPSQLQST